MISQSNNGHSATLTARLRAALAASGTTDAEISKAAGVPRSLVSRFRDGSQASLHLETAAKLATAIGGRLTLIAPAFATKGTPHEPEVCTARIRDVEKPRSDERNEKPHERRPGGVAGKETVRVEPVGGEGSRNRPVKKIEAWHKRGAAAMTKTQLMAELSLGGVRNKLTAERVARSHELHNLPNDAVIDEPLLQNWLTNRRPTSGGQSYTGKHAPLSESDLSLIEGCLHRRANSPDLCHTSPMN